MAQLIVRKETNELLFDTSLITYGLIKSGYLVLQESWTRRFLRSAQLDPNQGSSWTRSTVATPDANVNGTDNIWVFTVTGAISPILFLTGRGCLAGTSRSGSSFTFYYTSVDPNTKVYCFDLMRDTSGAPYLKTYNPSNVLTFNSLMPPLNIVTAVAPPAPTGIQGVFSPQTSFYPYAGGSYVLQQASPSMQQTFRGNVALTQGVEYAAFLPWSRSCLFSHFASGPYFEYSGLEGCAGYTGGIQFQLAPAPGTTQANPVYPPGAARPSIISRLPVDRSPTALVIETANYPFPFN